MAYVTEQNLTDVVLERGGLSKRDRIEILAARGVERWLKRGSHGIPREEEVADHPR